MEERLLFKLLQWAGIGVGEDTKEESIQEEMMTRTMHRWEEEGGGGGIVIYPLIIISHYTLVRHNARVPAMCFTL